MDGAKQNNPNDEYIYIYIYKIKRIERGHHGVDMRTIAKKRNWYNINDEKNNIYDHDHDSMFC